MATKVDAANGAACDEAQDFAARLIGAGFSVEQANVALRAALPLVNANARLRHRLAGLERRERTRAQVAEGRNNG